MFDAFLSLVDTLVPVLVAVVAAYSTVIVAKVNKIQKGIKTNHGSKNLGDAVDTIWNKMDKAQKSIDDIAVTIDAMQSKDDDLSERVKVLELAHKRSRRYSSVNNTGPIQTITSKLRRK